MNVQKNTFYHEENKIEYAVVFPNGYEPGKTYPVLLYLHGYGFVNATFDDMLICTPVRRARMNGEPFVFVIPHCPYTSWLLHTETLSAFCEWIATQSFCDTKRLYAAGTSMGGCSLWMLLLEKQSLFAAAVICCGQGPYWAAGFYKDIPLLLAHGTQDDVIYASESKVMAEKINANGGNVCLKLFDGLGHEIWEQVFTDSQTYAWLLQHKK